MIITVMNGFLQSLKMVYIILHAGVYRFHLFVNRLGPVNRCYYFVPDRSRAMLGRWLVVGGGGWTGSFLVAHLLRISRDDAQGEELVHVIDICPPKTEMQYLHNGALFHTCDITDAAAVEEAVRTINPRVVFHLASMIDLRPYPSELLEQINVKGTLNILNAIRQASWPENEPRFFVYTSTIDVVSGMWGVSNANEDTAYADKNPANHYKRTKIMAEKISLASDCDMLRTVALRPGHIYGPGDPILSYVLSSNIGLGSASSRMSFVYVQNCALAHILAALMLIKEVEGNADGQQIRGNAFFITDFDENFSDLYNLCGGRACRVKCHIPWWLVLIIVILSEWIDCISHCFFGRSLQHPVTGVSRGLLEACDQLTASSTKAREVLHYGNNKRIKEELSKLCGSCVLKEMDPMISREQAILRTQHYHDTGKIEF